MSNYEDIWYKSEDGLNLYARDYKNDNADITILCMHGLTRNSADFTNICNILHKDYRLISVDVRGRGKSDRDPNIDNYQPPTYVDDMFTLLNTLQERDDDLKKVVMMGTSMGGLMSMLMIAKDSSQFAGVIMNDIGPEVDQAGLDRIKGYADKYITINNWDDAAEQTRILNEVAFPHYTKENWMEFAHQLYAEDDNGVPQKLYDQDIFTAIANASENAVPPDLWGLFRLTNSLPTLLIRGETSDILHSDCAAKMQEENPTMIFAEIKAIGHAPMLNEPDTVNAIKNFLEGI